MRPQEELQQYESLNPRAERWVVFWLLIWAVRFPFHQDVPHHRPHCLRNKVQGCTTKPTTLKRERTENCLHGHADKERAPQRWRLVPALYTERATATASPSDVMWNGTSSTLQPRTHTLSSCWVLPSAPQPPNLGFGWVLGKHLNRVFSSIAVQSPSVLHTLRNLTNLIHL